MAIVALDFDGTLVQVDRPLPGAREAVNTLREAGHKVIIYSANRKGWIEKVLNNNDIRYDLIWDKPGKPIHDILIDDKGYHFRGSWNQELPDILLRLSGKDNRKWTETSSNGYRLDE